MKFLVVGHLCLDVIHRADGQEVRSYGGIYYALASLASLLDDGDRVIPVFGVNTADYEPLVEHLGKFPAIDSSGIFTFDTPTNTVHLYYRDLQNRIECSTHIARPVPFDRLKRNLDVDGVLVNMISGFDVTLETLDQIRIAVRGRKTVLHLDFHSLTLGVDGKNERFRRPVEEWRRWAFMTDTVQLNEDEILGLAREKMTEEQTAGHLLTLGIHGVVVTRGDRGVTAYRNDHKHVVRVDVPGIRVEDVRDTTGCGDIFGAAFHYHYVRTTDLTASADFANRIAAARVRMEGSTQLHELKHAMTTP